MTSSDAYFLSDSIQIEVGNVVSKVVVSDALVFSDNIQYFNNPLELHVNDRIQQLDSLTLSAVQSPLGFDVDDNLLLADRVILLLTLALVVADALGLVDAIHLDYFKLPQLSDTFSFDDSIVVGLASNLRVQIVDSFAFSDSTTLLRGTSFDSYIRRYLNDNTR